MGLFNKILAGENTSKLKKIDKIAQKVFELEDEYANLTDDELVSKTKSFKDRFAKGEDLDDLLPEVFAQVREADFRVLEMKPFPVQIVGGIALHQGSIAEMKTGEGKTLVATMPAVLNAIAGKVYIVTVNNYLAKRDSEWMGKVYRFLGYSVGLVSRDIDPKEKTSMYNCDIIYSTNNELGFDYLRDNMVVNKNNLAQSDLDYAILDEVDSILIDEARTPLIISGPGEKSTDQYKTVDAFVRKLIKGEVLEDDKFSQKVTTGDFILDEKDKTVTLTDIGITKAENNFRIENLSDPEHTQLNHHIKQALKARFMMKRDIDYVVQNGEVLIIDEFTGRLMTGRRFSDGLHQAIEAKEGVKVARESKTLATITFQNYFKMFKKIAGMTGTAKTEEPEFIGIYGLDVVEVPTNQPVIRDDANDVVYVTKKGKFTAVVEEVAKAHRTGRPILVGTISVETSEHLSKLLKDRGIKHTVLNAKFHAKEADIVADAGTYGSVTIATNMAGRGTDIVLGGNPDFIAKKQLSKQGMTEEMLQHAVSHAETEDQKILDARNKYAQVLQDIKKETDIQSQKVKDVGGLYIIGTERHESRRIDNQLRGRSGRQGDPGSSKFFISLEDDLMRLFGGDRVQMLMGTLNPDDNVPIEIRLISKQIEGAQKKIEARNFQIRKNVLEYDDVINTQRKIIYDQRKTVLKGENINQNIQDMLEMIIDESLNLYCPPSNYPEEWDLDGLERHLEYVFLPKGLLLVDRSEVEDLEFKTFKQHVFDVAANIYAKKENELKEHETDMREIERYVLLKTVDNKWMDHIDMMDQLKDGIRLRAYGQRDPIIEYRKEGFDMFEQMISSIQMDTLRMLFFGVIVSPNNREHDQKVSNYGDSKKRQAKAGAVTGRNALCPCGSGKKYKSCCGKN